MKACIFDLDGTLADTLESMAETANEVLAEFSLKKLPVDNYRYYCGEGASVLIRRCLLDAGDPDLVFLEEADRRYREKFNRDPMYKVRIYNGIIETLHQLKEEGAMLAVLSNKPDPAAQKVVQELFGDLFDQVLGQSREIPRKPSPAGAIRIAENFNVRPEECLYIGDTGTDMQTGRAAGMCTVGALWGFRTREELEENHAKFLAEKPEDLIKIYREIS